MSLIRLRENLVHLRLTSGYTATGLAKLLNKKSHSYVTHWELGTALPQTPDLVMLSQLYDVSINDLVRKDLTKVFTINSQN